MSTILELTLTGLCVLVIHGPEGEPHPSSVRALVVHAPDRTDEDPHLMQHVPLVSFRVADYKSGPLVVHPVSIGPDGDEVVNLEIPYGDEVMIQWALDEGLEDRFTLDWEGDGSVGRAPALQRFGINSIVQSGDAVAATVALPFGTLETRRVIQDSGNLVSWRFEDGGPNQPVADHVTLVSTAEQDAIVNLTVGGETYGLQAPEGTDTVQISITNLPRTVPFEMTDFSQDHVGHLKWFGAISGDRAQTVLLPSPQATATKTRQGGFCPSARIHLSPGP